VGTSFHAADPDSFAVVSDPADAYGRVVPGQVRAERSPTSSQRSVTLRSRRAGPRRSARCAPGIRPWARDYVADRHAEQVEGYGGVRSTPTCLDGPDGFTDGAPREPLTFAVARSLVPKG
jgi:hypothetical protein